MQAGQTKNGIGMTLAACLWLGLFPLLHFGTYTRITLDKWILMLVLSGATVLCFLADLIMRRVSRPRLLPLLLGAALLAWMLVSCLASPYDSGIWWIGASSRREGLASQLCYLGLFFLFSFARARFRPVAASASVGVLAFLAIVLLQRAGQNPFGLYPAGRSYATNPEFQGPVGNVDMGTGCLLLLTGLLLPALRPARPVPGPQRSSILSKLSALGQKSFFLLPLAGLLVSVWLVVTMDVQFGLLTLGVLAVAVLLRFLPAKARVPLLLLILVLVLLAVWYWPGTGGGIWELHEILHGRLQLSFGSNRIAVWLYTLSMVKAERPLLGAGSDTFALRFNDFITREKLEIPTRQGDLLLPSYFDTPHNEYLAQLANHGLPALILFALLIVSALCRRGKGPGAAASLPWRAAVLAYAAQASLSFSVCLVAPLFWAVLGLSISKK